MIDIKKIKNQCLNSLAISIAENFYISYHEAKNAINLSSFKDDIEVLDERELKALLNKSYNDIINNIWDDYKCYSIT